MLTYSSLLRPTGLPKPAKHKLLICVSQILLAAVLLAAPFAYAQDGGKMAGSKTRHDGKMSKDRMGDSEMSAASCSI